MGRRNRPGGRPETRRIGEPWDGWDGWDDIRKGCRMIRYDAAALLESLFDDSPKEEDRPTIPIPEPIPAACPAAAPDGPDLDMDGWVLRPDCRGRLGLERADLPEAARWWARWDFEDLLRPSDAPRTGLSEKTAPQDRSCGARRAADDVQHVQGDQPSQGHFWGLGGV